MNNGKVRIALVGAGNFAKAVHLENLKKLSDLYHLRAVISSTGSNAKSTAQRFEADYASTDYQDVLNDPDVDAVLISELGQSPQSVGGPFKLLLVAAAAAGVDSN